MNLVWAALADVAIVATFFRFGFAEFADRIGRSAFVVGGAGMLVVAAAVQLLFLGEFGRADGECTRRSCRTCSCRGCSSRCSSLAAEPAGQGVVIAVAKRLGTLALTVQLGLLAGRWFVFGVGLLCSALDLVYIGLLLRAHWRPGAASGQPVASAPAET